MSDAAMQLVEDTGLHFESAGLPRMTGRVLGWLSICHPLQQAAAELAAASSASSGSISTTARSLVHMGFRRAGRGAQRSAGLLPAEAGRVECSLEERKAEFPALVARYHGRQERRGD
jgi:hypothetical protein